MKKLNHPGRNWIVSVFAAGVLLFSYQNCGQASSGAAASAQSGGNISVTPSTQDPAEVEVLANVLNSYSVCSQIADATARLTCEQAALQNNAALDAVSTSATTTKTAVSSTNSFCYVVGPVCVHSQGSAADVATLDVCRSALMAQQNESAAALDSYMQSNPLGYAAAINNSCLYANNRCVVAVRCIAQ